MVPGEGLVWRRHDPIGQKEAQLGQILKGHMGFDQGVEKWVVALNRERKRSEERGEGASGNVVGGRSVKASVTVFSLRHMIEQVMRVTV